MTDRTLTSTTDDATTTERRNTVVIYLLLVSAFTVILNETIMGVALPRLTVDLGITEATGQWLTTGFMLTMAIVIPITGFLLQRFHLRPVFMTAMTLFTAGTLIAAIAPGFAVLLLGRIVQASGTAIMMPLLMTTVLNLVPAERRGRMMGNISIVIAVAPAIGPTISGLILSVFSWRWMFVLMLPIAIGALALGIARVRNVTTPRESHIDVLSVVLSALGFGGLIVGLSSIGESASGHTIIAPWIPIAIGVVALALFVARQLVLQRSDRALLDLRTFTSRTFSVSLVVIVIVMMAMFGMLILLPFLLQNVLGLDALGAGLILLPGGLVQGALAPLVGRLFDRVGPRPLIIPAAVVVSAAMWWLSSLSIGTPLWQALAAHITLSIGLAFMFTPLLTSALGSLPRQLYSHGSATFSTIQQVAAAAGTALFVTIMTVQSASLTSDGAGGQEAMAGGIQSAFFIGGIISIVAIAATFFVRRPETPADAPRPMAH